MVPEPRILTDAELETIQTEALAAAVALTAPDVPEDLFVAGEAMARYIDALAGRVNTLEAALEDAQNLTEFLHGCLTDPVFEYAYPEQTLALLAEWAQLAPRPEPCFHSKVVAGCDSCDHRVARHQHRAALGAVPVPEPANAVACADADCGFDAYTREVGSPCPWCSKPLVAVSPEPLKEA